MKKMFLMLAFSIALNLSYGQDLKVAHTQIPVTDVVVDAWTATLNDDKSFYEKTFDDYAKQEFGIKSKNDGKNEQIVEKASINRVSDKRGDLRLTFFTEGSDTKLAVSFLLGYDIWINPEEYGEGMEQLRQLTRDYLRFHYTEYYNEIIDQDLKVINGHKKDIDKSERSISNMRKQITKNEDKLRDETNANRRASMEKKNQQNREDIDKLSKEIPDLHKKIAALDEHVQQTKDTMKEMEEQYYNDEGKPQYSQPNNDQSERREYVEDMDSLDNMDEFEDKKDHPEQGPGN